MSSQKRSNALPRKPASKAKSVKASSALAPPQAESSPAEKVMEEKPLVVNVLSKHTSKPDPSDGTGIGTKLSALDAAAKVLAEATVPMTTKSMIEAMAAKKLWTSPGGKTPAATLYSAITREIEIKKTESRFRKTSKGHFEATGK